MGVPATQYLGRVCARHPELGGRRRISDEKCLGCARERDRRRSQYPTRQKARRAQNQRREKLPHRRAKDAKRRAIKRGALAALTAADHLRINALYAEAVRRTAETGIVHHVDHDVPLALGGAHHPDNLLVVPARINLSKGARYASTWDYISS